VLLKFFRWLYNPDEPDHRKRNTQPCMNGIKELRRKERSPYRPEDMWKSEDHEIFLKYSNVPRDRCWHAMANDTSARPHELLNLKIKDVIFKKSNNGIQYAEIHVSGKTTSNSDCLARNFKGDPNEGNLSKVRYAIVAAYNHYAGFGPGAVNIFRQLLGLKEVKWGGEYISNDNLEKGDDSNMNKRVIKTKQTSLSDFLK
jgi:integrase